MQKNSPARHADLGRIVPDWPAPSCIHACTTTREGGVSLAPFDSLNLGAHVGDDATAVRTNRARLMHSLALPAMPAWLTQVHGTQVLDAAALAADTCAADASYTGQPGVVCAVLTADCLPLLLCDRAGTRVAAVHGGWRGLAAGVIEAAITAMDRPAAQLMAWLGPAIGPQAFEVGAEVREIFLGHDARASQAFVNSPRGRYYADIYQLARMRLAACGVTNIYGGQWCTFNDTARFYSYRRAGVTGRMATLIWIG